MSVCPLPRGQTRQRACALSLARSLGLRKMTKKEERTMSKNNLWIPDYTHLMIERLAKKLNIPMSELVTTLVADYAIKHPELI